MNQQQLPESTFFETLKDGIWLLGVSSWMFGITDRSIAFSEGYFKILKQFHKPKPEQTAN